MTFSPDGRLLASASYDRNSQALGLQSRAHTNTLLNGNFILSMNIAMIYSYAFVLRIYYHIRMIRYTDITVRV